MALYAMFSDIGGGQKGGEEHTSQPPSVPTMAA